jgi:GrpB-like predicted nucleotidyltransferase (UPF0157 family)
MVELQEYDSAWPAHYARLRDRLWPAVEAWASGIEHVGSTSVPGLIAKPVIDIDIVMPSRPAFASIAAALARLGYRHAGNQGIEDREVFKGGPGEVRHHLYVCLAGGAALRNHLALRDALRADPALAARYAALKRALAAAGDQQSYWRGKTEFILAILSRQGFAPDELDAIRRAN